MSHDPEHLRRIWSEPGAVLPMTGGERTFWRERSGDTTTMDRHLTCAAATVESFVGPRHPNAVAIRALAVAVGDPGLAGALARCVEHLAEMAALYEKWEAAALEESLEIVPQESREYLSGIARQAKDDLRAITALADTLR